MYRSSLTLQPGPQQIERVNSAGSKSATECTDASSGKIAEGSVVFVGMVEARFAVSHELFEVFEGGKVDCAVGEHAD